MGSDLTEVDDLSNGGEEGKVADEDKDEQVDEVDDARIRDSENGGVVSGKGAGVMGVDGVIKGAEFDHGTAVGRDSGKLKT